VALEGTVQVSPQSVTLQVRPQEARTFNLMVKPARNFPIDLYLLMDLSFSMNDDLANLQNLASTLGGWAWWMGGAPYFHRAGWVGIIEWDARPLLVVEFCSNGLKNFSPAAAAFMNAIKVS